MSALGSLFAERKKSELWDTHNKHTADTNAHTHGCRGTDTTTCPIGSSAKW